MSEEEKFYKRMNCAIDEVKDTVDLVGTIGLWLVGLAFGGGTILIVVIMILNRLGKTL